MSNPAEYLLNFFQLNSRDQHRWPLRPLLEACNAIDDDLATRNQLGASTDSFRKVTQYVGTALYEKATKDLQRIETAGTGGRCTIDGPLRDLLGVLATQITPRAILNDEASACVVSLIQSVKETIRIDSSLPNELKFYMLQTITSLELELDKTALYGDFSVEDALMRLFGLIRRAEETSEKPEAWRKVWVDWGIPIVQGMIVNTPQFLLGAASLLAITS
ncbi:hypothetical protein [Lysinibacter cavernae]|uniref:Uncharacterized protein n=1 Tax=Lysinibacter cavernae TaxID=1640652 RepID=A0A7X5TV07_9MICO|nr:hypothetical protein [Lysinibacter cavernae]NIH55073.1 hypothetical protein [Lysinibacter cavernae]